MVPGPLKTPGFFRGEVQMAQVKLTETRSGADTQLEVRVDGKRVLDGTFGAAVAIPPLVSESSIHTPTTVLDGGVTVYASCRVAFAGSL